MKEILLIYNPRQYHHEIIETMICRYTVLFPELEGADIEIHVQTATTDESFFHYIQQKYPDVKIGQTLVWKYLIVCTMLEKIDMNSFFFHRCREIRSVNNPRQITESTLEFENNCNETVRMEQTTESTPQYLDCCGSILPVDGKHWTEKDCVDMNTRKRFCQECIEKGDERENPNIRYICHDVLPIYQNNDRAWFLTPLAKKNFLYASVLPYTEQRQKHKTRPIFIVQGSLKRRDVHPLISLGKKDFHYDFEIKVIGRNESRTVLDTLEKIIGPERFTFKNVLNFEDFHREFLDAHAILTAVSKRTDRMSKYYSEKLTSSINYAKAYQLTTIIDKDLQEIYQLENAIVYDTPDEFLEGFEKALHNFYEKT